MRGPALATWYPKKTVAFHDLQHAVEGFGLTTFDEAEDDREESIQMSAAYTLLFFVSMLTVDTVPNSEERAGLKRRKPLQVSTMPNPQSITRVEYMPTAFQCQRIEVSQEEEIMLHDVFKSFRRNYGFMIDNRLRLTIAITTTPQKIRLVVTSGAVTSCPNLY